MDGSHERTTRETTSIDRRRLNGLRHRLLKPKKVANCPAKTLPSEDIAYTNGIHLRSQGTLKRIPSRRKAPGSTNGPRPPTDSKPAAKRGRHISSPVQKYRGATGLATRGIAKRRSSRRQDEIVTRRTSSQSRPCLNGGSSPVKTTASNLRRPSSLLVNGESQLTGAGDDPQAVPRRPISSDDTAAGAKRSTSSLIGNGQRKRSYCRTRSRSAHSPVSNARRKSFVGKTTASTATTSSSSSPSTASATVANRLARSASTSGAAAPGASRLSRRTIRRNTVTTSRAGATATTVSNPQPGGAEHEAFVRAFATPTHLYRYLAVRHRHCPLFLCRNLTYFRKSPLSSEATSRSAAARTSIAGVVDRLLQRPSPLSALVAGQKPSASRQRATPTEVSADQAMVPNSSRPVSPGLLSAVPMLVKSPMAYWPSEMQLIFEGFFDSEKELDWVTVSASVSLHLRLGWSWRQKACLSRRSQPSPLPDHQPIALTCHNPALGSILPGGDMSAEEPTSVAEGGGGGAAGLAISPGGAGVCRIRPMEVLRQTKLSASHGGRLTSGQLEFRVSASERRRLKRIDSSTRVPSAAGGTVLLSSLTSCRKNGLGSTAYPVSYKTSPLPLFQPAALVSGAWTEAHPLLLTPGRYELRLGVDTDDSDDDGRPSPSLHEPLISVCNDEETVKNSLPKCRHSPAPPVSTLGVFEKFGLISKQAAEERQKHHHQQQPSLVTCNGGGGGSPALSGSALLITDSSTQSAGEKKVSGASNECQSSAGRGSWRRIRFPQTSVALDEYARWPRLRFRVVWQGREPADAAPGIRRPERLNGLVAAEPVSTTAVLQSLRRLSPRRCSSVANGPSTPPQLSKLNGEEQTSPAKSSIGLLSTAAVVSPLNRRASRQSASLGTGGVATGGGSTAATTTNMTSPAETISSSPVSKYPILRKTLQVLVTSPPARQQRSELWTSMRAPALSVRLPITYRFVYRDRVQQWSEAKNLVCPWCQLDCARRVRHPRGGEALLSHLRTCHPRFCFKPIWSGGNGSAATATNSSSSTNTTANSNNSTSHPSSLSGPTATRQQSLCIEVSLNDSYDGSNDCGLRRWDGSHAESAERRSRLVVPPSQLVGGWTSLGLFSPSWKVDSDTSISRQLVVLRLSRPMRRLPYTHLIFWRGAERATDQAVDPTLSVRPMAQGHNRIYYHTRTVQPLRACEFDFDSEAEDAPNWLCQHYQRKVEEFTDVNQGEKQLMQLWNHLLLSVRPSQLVVCDSQLPGLASLFIHRHAGWIHGRRLRCNLLLHLANLVDYGLMSASHLRQLISLYDRLANSPRLD